ncbi:cytochrome b6 [Geotalea uraniireducens]|uniref:Cytochrome b6 n=1 Tax=Geotalea uraniireducens TaxID=351604 RepID=A0ABN6VVK8_9BACT|nr:Rieske (2Fe-2S) protein [Geotalea uraniireducens]BDV44353.1 cytochrome b6 [Geotalea uraniireducens]
METVDRGRRRFIAALAAFAALLLGRRFLVPQRRPAEERLTVEKRTIPPRGALVFRERRLAVIREGGEIYALSLSCTHLGCAVTVTPDRLACPCHGSVFDRRGNVLKGPAARPLDRFRVEDDGDRVIVFL